MFPITDYPQYIYSIKEGLIKTHPIERIYNNLQSGLTELEIETEIRIINKYSYEIRIINYFWMTEELPVKLQIQKSFLEINNKMGFYPTWISYVISDNPHFYQSKIGFTMNNWEKVLNTEHLYEIRIIFDSEYEDGLHKNTISAPKIAYYLNENSPEEMNKMGLKSRVNSHPPFQKERFYFFSDVQDQEKIYQKLTENGKRIHHLYEVEMEENMILHTEPNSIWDFYTYDEISPEKIRYLKHL